MGVVELVLLAHTAILVVASLFMLYPVVAFAWNVAYTREMQLLSLAFLLLAGGYVAGVVVESAAASNALDLASAVLTFWAMWRLATRVPDVGDTDASFDSTAPEVEDGFRGGT